MGCGKSKHDVVAAATTATAPAKSAKPDGRSDSKKVVENVDSSSSVQKQVESETLMTSTKEREMVPTDGKSEKTTENVGPTSGRDVVGAIIIGGVREDGESEDCKGGNIESVISGGVSGKTTYYSPDAKEKTPKELDIPKDINPKEEAFVEETPTDVTPTDANVTKETPKEETPTGVNATKETPKEETPTDINAEKETPAYVSVKKEAPTYVNAKEETPKDDIATGENIIVPLDESTKEETKKGEEVEASGAKAANEEALATPEADKVSDADQEHMTETKEKEPEPETRNEGQ